MSSIWYNRFVKFGLLISVLLLLLVHSIWKWPFLLSLCAPSATPCGTSLQSCRSALQAMNKKLSNAQVEPTNPLGPHVFAVLDSNNQSHAYTRFSPLVWIGGVPRSGTTLMRVMLGAHPDVRCGAETRLIPRLLQMHETWNSSGAERTSLREAGISGRVLDSAISSFILELLTAYGPPADVLCSKDPLAIKYGMYINELFPNSKHILMIRDGRAVVHSIITRHVAVSGFDSSDFRQSLQQWSRSTQQMLEQCEQLGVGTRCLPVFYERLVLDADRSLRRVLRFLGLPWTDAVLHHQDFVASDGPDSDSTRGHKIRLSKVERSTDQVVRAVYRDSLGAWATNASLPGSSTRSPLFGPPVGPKPPKRRELLYSRDALTVAPMLSKLGYERVFAGLEASKLLPGAIPVLSPEQRPDYMRLESPLLQLVSD